MLPELRLQLRQLCVYFFLRFAALDDLFAVAAEEVIDCFDTDADGSRGLVFVEILEAEVRRAGILDDPFYNAIDGRVVTALEARDFKGDEIGVTCRELGRPNFVIGAARV